MAMTWDSIQIYGSNGEYINGKAEHRAFLEEWFSSGIGLS